MVGFADMSVQERGRANPLVAWRYWQLTAGWQLRSVSQRRFVWPPGGVMRSMCLGSGHDAPAEDCNCGISGAADLDTLSAQRLCLDADPLVVGEVALWGRIVTDAGGGFRAAHALPSSLLLVTETAPSDIHSEILAALRSYGTPTGTASLPDVVDDVSAAAIGYEAMARRVR